MSKVLTFSRVFPAYHPKAGEPTNFIEQIYNSLYEEEGDWSSAIGDTSSYVVELNHLIRGKKHHTIRAGHRFKVGDKFSPRVWSGKPYRSRQIIIAPDIEVRKVYSVQMSMRGDFKEFSSNTGIQTPIEILAKNDGLELNDFLNWFNKPFSGQIICWNENINY